MRGVAILFAFNLLGLLCTRFLHVPLPANVIGMILLLAALFGGVVKLEWIEESAGFLLRHMMLFFAPLIVGTIGFRHQISQNLLGILLSLIIPTLAVLLVSGWIAQRLGEQENQP